MKSKAKKKRKKSRMIDRRSPKAGLPPGTLIHVGEQKLDKPLITVLDYDENTFQEKVLDRVEEAFAFKETRTVTWINVDGLHDVSVIEKIGKHFDLHPLTLEDILHTAQRAKFENMETYLYAVLRMLNTSEDIQGIQSEQVSIILGDRFVLSFQETIGDVFDVIRDRLRNAKGRVRKYGPDYLLYALVDAIVDSYFLILEHLGEQVEALEDELVANPSGDTLRQIHEMKREMIFLRKSVWPLREMISGLVRSESPLIQSTTNVYLRDVYDHTIQVIDTVESFRDMVAGMLDIYLSSLSNRMNAIMKVLTIIATIFIPLTFVAGIYGMNFENMPELKWRYGYAGVWVIMITIFLGMIVFFRRKKWL